MHDPQVLKLAHPGLTLRIITPEVILQVLAGLCGLTVSSAEEAKNLFDKLSGEVSLVTRINATTIRHRSDVRTVMLALIQEEMPGIVRHIHEAAVSCYEQLDGLANRAEELYHRLSLNQPSAQLDSRWQEGLQNHLLGNIDELPATAQAFLSARTGIHAADQSIWEHANTRDWERHIVRTAAELLNSGQAENVLKVIGTAKEDIRQSGILSLLKTRALTQLGQLDDAIYTAEQALSSYYSESIEPVVRMQLINSINVLKTNNEDIDFTDLPASNQDNDLNMPGSFEYAL